MANEKSQFLGHGSCDKCGSTDAVGIYEVGPATCFNCGAVHYADEGNAELAAYWVKLYEELTK
tara:strand:- start:324 stop:512 length:189 start_codon:yes stop_codon:yes gene_type:complete